MDVVSLLGTRCSITLRTTAVQLLPGDGSAPYELRVALGRRAWR